MVEKVTFKYFYLHYRKLHLEGLTTVADSHHCVNSVGLMLLFVLPGNRAPELAAPLVPAALLAPALVYASIRDSSPIIGIKGV